MELTEAQGSCNPPLKSSHRSLQRQSSPNAAERWEGEWKGMPGSKDQILRRAARNGGETTAWAPVVRKGPGSCTKTQN